MFTGIVEELGAVRQRDGTRLVIASRTVAEDSPVGASVAVNGVCLTVVENRSGSLAFDLSEETLQRTALSRLQEGSPVNLERPVTLASRMGGHLVQGHVDGVGRLVQMGPDGVATIEAPAGTSRYLVEKGSVAVDGVSLTVAGVDGDRFTVALVPHTLEVTTLGRASPGDPLNLEVDLIAKYVERLAEVRDG